MGKKTPIPAGFFSDPNFRRKVEVVLDGCSSDPAKVRRAHKAAAEILAREPRSAVIRPLRMNPVKALFVKRMEAAPAEMAVALPLSRDVRKMPKVCAAKAPKGWRMKKKGTLKGRAGLAGI